MSCILHRNAVRVHVCKTQSQKINWHRKCKRYVTATGFLSIATTCVRFRIRLVSTANGGRRDVCDPREKKRKTKEKKEEHQSASIVLVRIVYTVTAFVSERIQNPKAAPESASMFLVLLVYRRVRVWLFIHVFRFPPPLFWVFVLLRLAALAERVRHLVEPPRAAEVARTRLARMKKLALLSAREREREEQYR